MEEGMNEWMKEWTDKWINEWVNEWMNEWMKERKKYTQFTYTVLTGEQLKNPVLVYFLQYICTDLYLDKWRTEGQTHCSLLGQN